MNRNLLLQRRKEREGNLRPSGLRGYSRCIDRLKQYGFAIVFAGLSWLLCSPMLFAQEHHAHGQGTHADAVANPLIEEMVKLDGAFREVVSAVAVDDGSRVRKAIESMHGTMEKTHEGVHHGTVRIPKNADRVEDFVRRDKQFHADLERLAAAAGKQDRDGMLQLTKKLLDQCVRCHQDFRNP